MNCCDFTSQGLEVSVTAPQSPEALLYTCYKQRSDEFRKLFREMPESEKLIAGKTDRGRYQVNKKCKNIINSKCLLVEPQYLYNHIRCCLNDPSFP